MDVAMTTNAAIRCLLCNGPTVRGLVLDRDYDDDLPACFALEGDHGGFIAPTYPDQLPISVYACLECGHLSQYVSPARLRQRLKQLGRPH